MQSSCFLPEPSLPQSFPPLILTCCVVNRLDLFTLRCCGLLTPPSLNPCSALSLSRPLPSASYFRRSQFVVKSSPGIRGLTPCSPARMYHPPRTPSAFVPIICVPPHQPQCHIGCALFCPKCHTYICSLDVDLSIRFGPPRKALSVPCMQPCAFELTQTENFRKIR